MPRRRKLDWRGEIAIREAVKHGWTAQRTLDHLWELYGTQEIDIDGEMPSLRTVQGVMSKYARRDPSGEWTLTQAGPDEIEAALPAAQAAILDSGGRERLTNREADLTLRIRAAAPDLGGSAVLEFARAYIICEQRHGEASLLDLALVIGPWRNRDAAAKYFELIGGELTSPLIETLPYGPVLRQIAPIWHEGAEQRSAASRPRKATRRLEGRKS